MGDMSVKSGNKLDEAIIYNEDVNGYSFGPSFRVLPFSCSFMGSKMQTWENS